MNATVVYDCLVHCIIITNVGLLLAQLPNTLRRIRSYRQDEHHKLCVGREPGEHGRALTLQGCSIPSSEEAEGLVGGGVNVAGDNPPGVYFDTVLRDSVLAGYYTPHEVYNDLKAVESTAAAVGTGTASKTVPARDVHREREARRQGAAGGTGAGEAGRGGNRTHKQNHRPGPGDKQEPKEL